MSEERRSTTLRLTVGQLAWLKQQTIEQRRSQQAIIEQAIIAAGAPREAGGA